MLIVGQVSSEEENNEVRFVAQVFAISERFRYLGSQLRKKD